MGSSQAPLPRSFEQMVISRKTSGLRCTAWALIMLAVISLAFGQHADTSDTWDESFNEQPTAPIVLCSGYSGNIAGPECLAWQAFYDTTGGGGCSRDDPCACYAYPYATTAVRCQDGHITQMDLGGTSISGSIPQSFCSLDVDNSCALSFQGSPTYACPLPNCADKLTACGVTSCQRDTR